MIEKQNHEKIDRKNYFCLFMSWLKKHFWADNRGKVSTGKVPFYKSNVFLIWDPLLAGYFVAKSNGQITPVFITRDQDMWYDHFIWSKLVKLVSRTKRGQKGVIFQGEVGSKRGPNYGWGRKRGKQFNRELKSPIALYGVYI